MRRIKHIYECTAKILYLFTEEGFVDELKEGQTGYAIFDQTPFYPGGGGQVCDTGYITWSIK